jgi:hypothetical protein
MTASVTPKHDRRTTRIVAVILAVLAFGFGVAGLMELSPEQLGVGLLGFGILLALLSLLAQSAEHFARSPTELPAFGHTRGFSDGWKSSGFERS